MAVMVDLFQTAGAASSDTYRLTNSVTDGAIFTTEKPQNVDSKKTAPPMKQAEKEDVVKVSTSQRTFPKAVQDRAVSLTCSQPKQTGSASTEMMDVALWDELPMKADSKKKRRRRRPRSHLQDMLDLELPDSLSSYQTSSENQTSVMVEKQTAGAVKPFRDVHGGATGIDMYKSVNSTAPHTPGQQGTTPKAPSTSTEFPSQFRARSSVVRTTQAPHIWAAGNGEYNSAQSTPSQPAAAPLSKSNQVRSIQRPVQHKYVPTFNPMGLDPYAQFMSYVFTLTETTVYHPTPVSLVPNRTSTPFDGPFPAAVLLPQSLPSFGYSATMATDRAAWDRGKA